MVWLTYYCSSKSSQLAIPAYYRSLINPKRVTRYSFSKLIWTNGIHLPRCGQFYLHRRLLCKCVFLHEKDSLIWRLTTRGSEKITCQIFTTRGSERKRYV